MILGDTPESTRDDPTKDGLPGPLWRQIRDALSDDLESGRYAPGAKLPTEAALAHRFGVNRHTVRRALDALRKEGRIHVRRGSGAYVIQGRVDYAIGRRTRFSQNLADMGHTAARALLRCEEIPAGPREAEHLRIAPGAPVTVIETVSAADGLPVVYGRAWFPAERLPGIGHALREERGITAALSRLGVTDYQRLWTRLVAEMPEALIARHLRMEEHHPVLRSDSLNATMDGEPVEYGHAWFCSDRIALVIDGTSFG